MKVVLPKNKSTADLGLIRTPRGECEIRSAAAECRSSSVVLRSSAAACVFPGPTDKGFFTLNPTVSFLPRPVCCFECFPLPVRLLKEEILMRLICQDSLQFTTLFRSLDIKHIQLSRCVALRQYPKPKEHHEK